MNPELGAVSILASTEFQMSLLMFVALAGYLLAYRIAITANVLREMGKLQTEAAKAIIGAAVIDDVLALLALSVSEGVVSGELSLTSLLITAIKALAFIALGILAGKLILTKLIVR